jgi:hypothetical protein
MNLFKNTFLPAGQLPLTNIEYFPIFLLLLVSIGLAFIILGASYFFSVQKPDLEKILFMSVVLILMKIQEMFLIFVSI